MTETRPQWPKRRFCSVPCFTKQLCHCSRDSPFEDICIKKKRDGLSISDEHVNHCPMTIPCVLREIQKFSGRSAGNFNFSFLSENEIYSSLYFQTKAKCVLQAVKMLAEKFAISTANYDWEISQTRSLVSVWWFWSTVFLLLLLGFVGLYHCAWML